VSKPEETQPESADEAVVAPEEMEVVAESSDPVRPAQTNRSGALLSLTLSIVATAAVGVGGWLGWTEVQTIRGSVQSMDSIVQTLGTQLSELKKLQTETRALESHVQRLETDVSRADARNQSVIDRVEMVAEQLAKAQVDTRSSYVLAEAEYLLKLADQRLLIERNPETAVNLMRTAQALFGQLQDGRLLSVRELLAQDLNTLSSIPTIDVLGIQADLLALDPVLDELQLPVRRLMADTPTDQAVDVQKWLGDLSEFIRIREVNAPITPLVSASDAGRAREVLRLSLEQIKVALIREDQALFDAGLAQAKRLCAHFFDVTAGAGLKVMSVLSALEGTPIVREIPDAAQGLRALKAYRDALTQERISATEVKQ
jgi:uroporphyrin-3 C-methyltransferase